jgi:hypothetical protein
MVSIKTKIAQIRKKKISLVTVGEIADVRKGISTGDNAFYYLKKVGEIGPYKEVEYNKIIKNNEFNLIHHNEKLRNEIFQFGIDEKMFEGRTIIPCDKAGGSNTTEKKLSNYYSPVRYFIDWNKTNVNRLRSLTIYERKKKEGKKNIPEKYKKMLAAVLRNPKFHFKEGITFPMVGIPTFRKNSGGVFDNASNCFFVKENFQNYFTNEFLLGILSTELTVYILKNFINNTVNNEVDDIKKIPIPIPELKIKNEIEKQVTIILKKLKEDPNYNYQDFEQIKIKNLVYQVFGFDEDLIKEVEDWFIRKYPHLRKD